jgi:hypothetical protein
MPYLSFADPSVLKLESFAGVFGHFYLASLLSQALSCLFFDWKLKAELYSELVRGTRGTVLYDAQEAGDIVT